MKFLLSLLYHDNLGWFTLGSSNVKAIFCKKSLSRDFYGSNCDGFWTGNPLMVNWKAPTPERHVNQSENVFWATERANRTKIATCGLAEEMEQNKMAREESHKTVMFHQHMEAPLRNWSAPNVVSVNLTDVITPAKLATHSLVLAGREVDTTFYLLPRATALKMLL